MANYPYIIASLPDFTPDFERHEFDYDGLVTFIKGQCPAKDAAYIDLLQKGLDEGGAEEGFYDEAAASGNAFIRNFFSLDHSVRSAKVAFLDGLDYEGPDFEGQEEIPGIFATENIIEREKRLDRFYWEKAEDLVLGELFSIDIVLSFLVKANIVRRWNRLDPAEGAELFGRLVQEVRGTFKGVEYNPDTK